MNDNHWGNMAELRMAAESLADMINLRTRVHNRIRSGSPGRVILSAGEQYALLTADSSGTFSKKEIEASFLGDMVLNAENTTREYLRQVYEQTVPLQIREWAAATPVIASGELFPRIVGLAGNPRYAVPLKMEGTGKDRRAVPDGAPYLRECTCGARARGERCACKGLRSFWQYCGVGSPDLVPEKGNQEVLLRMGKMTTVRPLLYTFSERLQMAAGKEGSKAQSCELYKIMRRAKADAATKRHYKICRNRKPPPLKSNGCGIVAHPEWGEPGSAWRPGHQQAHSFRIVQKELLRGFWVAAEHTTW